MAAGADHLAQWVAQRSFAVTGAQGALGMRLVQALLRFGAPQVVCVGRRAGGSTSRRLRYVVSDVLSLDKLEEAFTNVDTVFHLAANANAHRCQEAPLKCMSTNTMGTATVTEACRKSGVNRLLLTSTSHVYSITSSLPATEDSPAAPASIYAASKLAAENLLYGLCTSSATLSCDILRMCNIYGAHLDPETVLGRALTLARNGQDLEMQNLDASRDFMHVDDAVTGLLMVASTDTTPGSVRVLNISPGKAHAVHEAATIIAELATAHHGREIHIRGSASLTEDIFFLDNTKLLRLTGWQPTINLHSGLVQAWQELCFSEGAY